MLTGTEVKSLRKGQANIAESYASWEDGGSVADQLLHPRVPGRRALLPARAAPQAPAAAARKEIHKLSIAVERQGMTMVPLELYFNARGIAKLKIALAQGKKLHDKREADKKRDWNREKARLMRDKG